MHPGMRMRKKTELLAVDGKKEKKTPLLAFPLALAAALFLSAEARGLEFEEMRMVHTNPHDFTKKELCSICHTDDPPLLKRDAVTTCARCHPGNIANHPVTNHPMGLMTKIKIPPNLPLTEDNEMVCFTCHDPHKKTGHPRMLRVNYFKLCASCHVGY